MRKFAGHAQRLAAAFEDLVIDPDDFVWKGIEFFWGRKP
jgi:hypothetical protein